MPRSVKGPDGVLHTFPDDATDGEISAALDAAPAHVRTWADTTKDVTRGAAKGVGDTFITLGELVHKIPGVTMAVDALYGKPGLSKDAFAQGHQDMQTTNTAEAVGKGAERVGEVLLTGNALSGAAKTAAATLAPRLAPIIGETAAGVIPRAAVDAAMGAGVATVQGGNPTVGAILGGAAGAASAGLERAAGRLSTAAEKQVVQALGPTKERFKAIAERRASEILRRGLGGSRESLKAESEQMLERVGQQIDDALTQVGGKAVDPTPVVNALETAKDAFRTTAANGKTVVFEPRAVKQLGDLQGILSDIGPSATIDQLTAIRRAWDKVVSQAGGFAQRSAGAIGVPLKDQSEAWAKREATGAIRQLLETEAPDLAAINKEYSFWRDIDDVLGQTLKRTQPQGSGVGKAIAEAAGAGAGAVAGSAAGPAGSIGGALALAKVTGILKSAFASPRWAFASASAKDRLAQAISSGQAGAVAAAAGRIVASGGAQATASR